jgi:hypothetical protein
VNLFSASSEVFKATTAQTLAICTDTVHTNVLENHTASIFRVRSFSLQYDAISIKLFNESPSNFK